MWPTGRPLTVLEAWIDILFRARWRPGLVNWQEADVYLERGELITSIRQLAKDWKWDRKRVRRILNRWSASGSILSQKRDHQGVHLTVCNYNTYNFSGTTNGATDGPPTGPLRDHERNNKACKTLTTTRAVDNFGWPCEACEASPFRTFDEYVKHVQVEHPEVFGNEEEE